MQAHPKWMLQKGQVVKTTRVIRLPEKMKHGAVLPKQADPVGKFLTLMHRKTELRLCCNAT